MIILHFVNVSSKSTEVETSNKLVDKINKFVENYNYDISKNKESCINTYNNICKEIFNYLKTIKDNRTKNRTYSLLYKRITQKRYVKTLEKVQKNVDGELKDLYMIDENKVLTNVKNKEKLDDIDINNIDTDNKEYKEKVQTEVYDGKKALAKSQLDDSFSSLLESKSDNSGYFTVWNRSIKNALERLSEINLTNTLSRT